MGVEVDVRVQHMGAVGQAAERGGMDDMSLRLQDARYRLIAPTAMTTAMHQDKSSHIYLSPACATWPNLANI